jgi:hypothetical protein
MEPDGKTAALTLDAWKEVRVTAKAFFTCSPAYFLASRALPDSIEDRTRSIEEIADIVGISVVATNSRLLRARITCFGRSTVTAQVTRLNKERSRIFFESGFVAFC